LRSPGARAKSDPDALSWSRLSRKPLQEPKSPATENWNEMASSEEAGVPTKERPTRAIAAARRTAMARLGPNVAPMTSRPVPVSLPEYFSFSWHLAHKCTRGSTQQAPAGLPRPTRSGDRRSPVIRTCQGAATLSYCGEMDSLRREPRFRRRATSRQGPMIAGTVIRPLKRLVDERGSLMEMMRLDWSDVFKSVPMSYVSMSYPGVIRAWHAHPRTKQLDSFVVPSGMIKAVVYDEATREVNEHILGEDNPVLLSFDGTKWHGFKCIGTKPCLLINFPDKMYDYATPDEARRPFNDPAIPYNWDIVMK